MQPRPKCVPTFNSSNSESAYIYNNQIDKVNYLVYCLCTVFKWQYIKTKDKQKTLNYHIINYDTFWDFLTLLVKRIKPQTQVLLLH